MFQSLEGNDISRSAIRTLSLEGVLYALSGIPLLICVWCYDLHFLLREFWIVIVLFLSVFALLFSAINCYGKPEFVKYSSIAGMILAAVVCLPEIITSPMAALTAIVVLSFLIYFVNENIPEGKKSYAEIKWHVRILYRARFATITVSPFLIAAFIFYKGNHVFVPVIAALCGLIAGITGLLWSLSGTHKFRARLNIVFFFIISLTVIYGTIFNIQWLWFSILWPAGVLVFLPRTLFSKAEDPSWIEPLLDHPARLLVFTFSGLIAAGTFLLILPVSSSTGQGISPIDAAFTSVSAVCITGLIVLDTPVDFSGTGQLFILLLIQAGGLGIMTIATIALHAIGKRFSLRQERVLAMVSGDDRGQLFKSLRRVFIFTILAESVGAVVLSVLFYMHEYNFISAVWRAVFTSVSAFCNAGFALQSDSLSGYQQCPLILHAVAVLIILGGLSPAVCLFVPDFICGKKVPVPVFLVLITTGILLLVGTVIIAAMEWNSALNNLSFMDKINNAWFQSVTLRTAGFNSIDIASVSSPTYLVMLFLMFIGGSPGGTAGGVKTTTLAVFGLCMVSITTGHPDIVVKKRKIETQTVYKAIAVTGAGIIVLFISVLGLELTQFIPVRDIVFEVFSALGTVGLSTGATSQLDEIGKVIIMITMFLGRIGPLTMFTVLSAPHIFDRHQYAPARIQIT